jgi:hypothetical protein
MKFFSIIHLSLFFVLLSLFGCDEPATGPNVQYSPGFQSERSPYVIDGTVVDKNGTPVDGAEIHYLFTMSTRSFSKAQSLMKSMPTTTIGFGVPKETYVTLRIFRLGTREHIATLVDGVMPAGKHIVSMDFSKITNGMYIYQLNGDGIFSQRLMVYLNEDLSALTKATPLTKTDRDGKFRLPHSLFGLDESFTVTSEAGPEPTGIAMIDSIGIVIHRTGTMQVQWLKIDKFRNTTATFTLQ